MANNDLMDQLGQLSAGQLDTITFLSGVAGDGTVASSGAYWIDEGKAPSKWQSAGSVANPITFSFDPSVSSAIFTPAVEAGVAQALALWSDLAGINFRYTTDYSNADVAINLAPTGGGTGESDPRSLASSPPVMLDTTTAFIQINLDPAGVFGNPASFTFDSGYGVESLVHEVGHLLGLGHAGQYNATGGGHSDFGAQERSAFDVLTWSIMSYVNPTETTAYSASFVPAGTKWNTTAEYNTPGTFIRAPFTPMGLDIFAAQRLYGAPSGTALAGGQTFGFHSNITYTAIDGTQQALSVYDFNKDPEPVVTLYDQGTGNTLDLSGFTLASTVDLNAGAWSSTAGLVNNIFIEYGTAIDNAIGGAGNDSFTLNAHGDTIDGMGGTNSVTLAGTRADYSVSRTASGVTLTDISTSLTNTLNNVQSVTFADGTVAMNDLLPVTWIGGDTGNFFNDANNWFPAAVPTFLKTVVIANGVAVSVNDSRAIFTLGLGTFALPGASLPTVVVNGGSLGVVENIVATSTGIFPGPTDAQVVSGGGTIDIGNGGTLEVGGTVDAGIAVDFMDGDTDMIRLDSVTSTAATAFAGTIRGFTQGDTIVLGGVQTDATDAAFYIPGSDLLTVTRDGNTVATLDVAGPTPLLTGNFVLGSVNGALAIGEAPILAYAWNLAAAKPGDDWTTAADWLRLPVDGSPGTAVPRSADSAYIVGGVVLDVTTDQTIATLGLGTVLSPGAPLPTLFVSGARLDVTTAILGSFTGAFAVGVPSGSFAGGGTIGLLNGATLTIEGTADAAITVNFEDGNADTLQLDGVNAGAPGAFAGAIAGFKPGNTITLGRVRADATDALAYDAGTHVLTLTEDGLTIATLNVAGTYSKYNFAVTGTMTATGENVTNITEGPLPPANLIVVGAAGTSKAGLASLGDSGGPGSAAAGTNIGNGIDTALTTGVTGGGGGAGANNQTGSGTGGAGGDGGSASATTNSTDPAVTSVSGVSVVATAVGGAGGTAGLTSHELAGGTDPGAKGGAGGSASASATATNAIGPASASGNASGGAGGAAFGSGVFGGAGGVAYIGTIAAIPPAIPGSVTGTVSASGTSARAVAKQYGGSGGGGSRSASGGAGASSVLSNAVDGTATGGALYLYQKAVGGSGGYSDNGLAGMAGTGISSLSRIADTAATNLGGVSRAIGGAGGSAGGLTSGAAGGGALALLSLAGAHTVTAQGAYAVGGAGGSVGANHGTGFGGYESNGTGGQGGDADAKATATSSTTGTDRVEADDSATGGRGGNAPFVGSLSGTASGSTGSGGAGGASVEASATATQTATPAGGAGVAYTTATGGRGGAASGVSQSGGLGGAASGSYAKASGFSAFAVVTQTGGSGGPGYAGVGILGLAGASGGAGADSTLLTTPATGTNPATYAVKGTATGGSVTVRQIAIGGAGGASSNGVIGGTAGTATSTLVVTNTVANGLFGASRAYGGAGGGGGSGYENSLANAPGNATAGAPGGAATATFDETGARQIGSSGGYSASAVGGAGGATSGTGVGGAGGAASASSMAISTTTQSDAATTYAHAVGGAGGANSGSATNGFGGASGGTGGAVTGTRAIAQGGGPARAGAQTQGGAGGGGTGLGHKGGDGGIVSGTYAEANGLYGNAYAQQIGGTGGRGDISAGGGAGASSSLTNAVSGSAAGRSLTLKQTAIGGAGGYGKAAAGGGVGGAAYSYLTFNDVSRNATQASSLSGTAQATGGAGGGDNTTEAADGGLGNAAITLTGATQVHAFATATGGTGVSGPNAGVGGNANATATGTATGPGADGTANVTATATGGNGLPQGHATATATAITTAGQQTQASSDATGSLDITNTTATTGGTGLVTGLIAGTSATGAGTVATLSGVSIGNTAPSFRGPDVSDYALVLGSPAGVIDFPSMLAGKPNLSALRNPVATVLSYSTQGASGPAGGNGLATLTSTVSYTLNATNLSGYLIAGLAGDDSFGAGFSSLTFTATVAGVRVFTDVFNGQPGADLAAAQSFFNDSAVNLGGFTATNGLVVSLALTLVTSNGGDGFGTSIFLGTTGGNGPPVITAPGTAIAGQGHARTIVGVSLSETNSGSTPGEIFTAKISDPLGRGLLSASTAAGGATISGSGTNTLTIAGSLTQVNTALLTLSDMEADTAPDTIALNASDSLGGDAAQASIAVTVNGPPTITTLEFATVNQSQVAALSGVTLSEAGDTANETFTATLSDKNGLLAATSFTGGAAVTGSGTTGLIVTGSLAQVNAALATLSETNPTPGLDPIVLNATDGLGGFPVAPGSIVVSVNEGVPSVALGGGADASIADLPGGGSVVVYDIDQVNNVGPVSGVYARLYRAPTAAGQPPQPAGAAFLVAAGGAAPTVAVQSGGQFLVVWELSDASAIWGALYSADGGTLIQPPFEMTTAAAGESVTSPDIIALPGGYLLTFETGNDAHKTSVTSYQAFNDAGERLGSPTAYPDTALTQAGIAVPINNTFSPRITGGSVRDSVQTGLDMVNGNPGSGGIGDLLAEVMAAATGLGNSTGQNAIAMSFPDPSALTGLIGSVALAGTAVSIGQPHTDQSMSAASASAANPATILLTPAGDGVTRVSPEITALSNGDFVVAWDQIAPADATWTVAGQIVTPLGQFVGSGFTVSTALPASATPDRPGVDWLPNGDFVVTYDAGISNVASQKFDASGNRLGGPFGVGGTSPGSLATSLLGDGTLLTLAGGTAGTISGGTFFVAAQDATWGGTAGTDLGTAGNWQPVAIPDATETLTFNAATGGTLTGTVIGMNAIFSAAGAWVLQAASLTLAGEQLSPSTSLALSDTGSLSVSAGSIAASGIVDIDSASGASMTILGGAQLNDLGIALGFVGGQSGSVTVSGVGTAIQNTGTAGSLLIGGGGSGQATISGGASVIDTAGGTLGASTGGDGSLTASGAGSRFNVNGELDVGAAGSGHLRVENQATVLSGGNTAFPSQGFDMARAAGGTGDATVSGANSLLSNTGQFVIGDAGLGSLSIQAGGTIITNPGIVAGLAGAVIANTASASGSSVSASGAGSNLEVVGAMVVGGAGFGQLSISQSATVTAESLDAAAAAGGDGAVIVTGGGSVLIIAGLLTVGDQSSGSLNIVNGASVSVGGLTIGTGASGSGNVVIGPGSHLTLTGTNINVGLAGSAVLDIQGGTLGLVSGTTLSPGTFGRIVQVGGLIDPATLFDASGGSFGGGGTAEASGTIVNSSLASVAGGAETLLAPAITSSDPANVAGVWSVKSNGTLVLDVNTFDNSQTIQFGDLTGVLTIGQQVTLDATQTPQTSAASALSGFAAPIVGYKAGDKITFSGLSVASDSVSGNVVTLFDNAHTALGSLTFQTSKGGADNAGAAAAKAQIVPCLAAGTRIETEDGPRAVEELAIGDVVVLANGGCEPIVWIGQRTVNCPVHPNPETVWPVRVQVGAFGANVPVRDLYLSPDHAVFVNEVLVPVKLLVNGTSITQAKRDRVAYYHVELRRHDVILAEGLAVESYLDLGDRANFGRGGETARLFPDFAMRLAPETALVWETRGAAPLVMAGAQLTAARLTVSENAPRCRSGSARSSSQAG